MANSVFSSVFLSPGPPPRHRDESVVSRDQHVSVQYTSRILISQMGSKLPHRINCRQTNTVNFLLFTNVPTLSTVEITCSEVNTQQIGIRPLALSTFMVTIGPIHRQRAADMALVTQKSTMTSRLPERNVAAFRGVVLSKHMSSVSSFDDDHALRAHTISNIRLSALPFGNSRSGDGVGVRVCA